MEDDIEANLNGVNDQTAGKFYYRERSVKTLKEGMDDGIDKKGICGKVKAEWPKWI